MRGKYSPTVTEAYQANRDWHRNYAQGNTYDPEGFDAYGYNAEDRDRAGNEEHEYYPDDDDDSVFGSRNSKYEAALADWGFDGVKPCSRYALEAHLPDHLRNQHCRPVPKQPSPPSSPEPVAVAHDEHTLPCYLEDSFDSIDAAMFSGDAFQSLQAIARAEFYMQRWAREVARLKALPHTA